MTNFAMSDMGKNVQIRYWLRKMNHSLKKFFICKKI